MQVIEINCFKKQKNILIFIDFTSVSELECEKFANYKNIKQVCELWNQGYVIEEICKRLHTQLQTVQHKLRLGNKYGICNYSKKLNMHFHKITNSNRAS